MFSPQGKRGSVLGGPSLHPLTLGLTFCVSDAALMERLRSSDLSPENEGFQSVSDALVEFSLQLFGSFF